MRAPALILAAALAAPLAQAETMTFVGTGVEQFNFCHCADDLVAFVWRGTFEVASQADGFYLSLPFVLESNVIHFEGHAATTFASGRVVSFGSSDQWQFNTQLRLNEMTVGYSSSGHDVISSGASARFVPDTPITAPVPEPETWALMLAGLGLCGWLARRARS